MKKKQNVQKSKIDSKVNMIQEKPVRLNSNSKKKLEIITDKKMTKYHSEYTIKEISPNKISPKSFSNDYYNTKLTNNTTNETLTNSNTNANVNIATNTRSTRNTRNNSKSGKK